MSVLQPMVYAYGIVRLGSTAGLPGGPIDLAGATFGRPRLLLSGSLAAIVSDLRLSKGVSLDALLRNSRHAEQLVLHHHRVLEELVETLSVLPFRFGVMFKDDQGVAVALEQNRKALLEAIGRIDGATEWGLKIYCAPDQLGRRLAGEIPAITELETDIASADEGKAFFLRKRLKSLTEKEIEQAITRCVNYTTGRLDAVVREFAPGKLQPAEMHGRGSEMVLNGACLVDRGLKEGFFQLLEDMFAAYAGFGFDYEITGPWPPYSFADCQLGGSGRAA